MKKTIFAAAAFAFSAAFALSGGKPLRPPSAPIVSCDPFFSIWSPTPENPAFSNTEIWFGAKQPVRVFVELDGVRYRLLGAPAEKVGKERGGDTPALACDGVEVRALTTEFRYSDGCGRKVRLSFMTPKFADELDVFSRPVAYGTVAVEGAEKSRVFVEISAALATNEDGERMVWRDAEVAGMKARNVGRRRQRALSSAGDSVRCNWGYAWVVNPESEGPAAHFMLAYDDVVALEFLEKPLSAWWRRNGETFEVMLASAAADRERLAAKADAFDKAFSSRAERVGGRKYADLAALAYRQSFAACNLVAGPDGRPYYLSKENSSNGCIGTVDVLYPQFPLLLLASDVLARATLEPVLAYAVSGKWPYPYAPHDLGTYPWANGQVYYFDPSRPTAAGQEKGDASRMPVEECGNMLIALCALSEHSGGDCSLAREYWPTVSSWAGYLERFGFDPGEQLCTDDFAGHLAHNANLSIKSILAFASYARLAERLGKKDEAERFAALAKGSVPKWLEAAKGGAHGGYRLAFDRPGTWSVKYNLVWDRLLGFNLFPPEVAAKEIEVYRKTIRPFGLPLDSRSEYGKVDWNFWAAALAGGREGIDFITDATWRYANETPDRNPFPDWAWMNNGRVRGFLGRSVIGGVFMPMLAESFSVPLR